MFDRATFYHRRPDTEQGGGLTYMMSSLEGERGTEKRTRQGMLGESYSINQLFLCGKGGWELRGLKNKQIWRTSYMKAPQEEEGASLLKGGKACGLIGKFERLDREIKRWSDQATAE